jgi:hypothetical protein
MDTAPRRQFRPARLTKTVSADKSQALPASLWRRTSQLPYGIVSSTRSQAFQSADAAAGWARDGLIAKNSLVAADARLVEEAFERRLTELSREVAEEVPASALAVTEPIIVQQVGPDDPSAAGLWPRPF